MDILIWSLFLKDENLQWDTSMANLIELGGTFLVIPANVTGYDELPVTTK